MKSLQHLLRPAIKRNYCLLRYLCSYSSLKVSTTYVMFLGVLGMSLSIYDMFRIIRCGSRLPCGICKYRLVNGKCATPETERDMKLIAVVLSLEYYTLLMLGASLNQACLFLPYLILYGVIITMEFICFNICVLMDGISCISKPALLQSILTIYNWLAIFCTFLRLYGVCE